MASAKGETYVDMRPARRADLDLKPLECMVDKLGEAIRDAIHDEEEATWQTVKEVRICPSLWPNGARAFKVDGIEVVRDESLSNGAIVCLPVGDR